MRIVRRGQTFVEPRAGYSRARTGPLRTRLELKERAVYFFVGVWVCTKEVDERRWHRIEKEVASIVVWVLRSRSVRGESFRGDIGRLELRAALVRWCVYVQDGGYICDDFGGLLKIFWKKGGKRVI